MKRSKEEINAITAGMVRECLNLAHSVAGGDRDELGVGHRGHLGCYGEEEQRRELKEERKLR